MRDNGDDKHNAPRRDVLTPEERERLVERHFETALARKAMHDANFAGAVNLGAAMKKLTGK